MRLLLDINRLEEADPLSRRRLHEVQIGWFERGSVLRHDYKFGERTRS